MVEHDPRIFKPEVEEQAFRDAVNRGYLNPDGTAAGARPSAPVGGGWSFRLMMLLLPFITCVMAAFAWMGGIAGFAPRFRAVLTAVLPEAWVATTRDGAGQPVLVGFLLAVLVTLVLTGLLFVRRAIRRMWLRTTGFSTFLMGLVVFGISASMVLVLILSPGLVLVGASIAAGADLGTTPVPAGATIRAWPLVLTALAAVWLALGATRRAAWKRSAHLTAHGPINSHAPIFRGQQRPQ